MCFSKLLIYFLIFLLWLCFLLFWLTEPYSEYKIKVQAYTNGHNGNSSEEITQWTDISGPSPPLVTNLTCLSEDVLFISWKRPLEFYHTLDWYSVTYRNIQYNDLHEIVINTTANNIANEVSSIRVTTDMVWLKISNWSRFLIFVFSKYS